MSARKNPKTPVALVAEPTPQEKAREELHMAYDAYLRSMGQEPSDSMPEPKVMFVSFIGSIATAVLGYALGMKLAELACLGMFWLTGWAYFSLAIYVIGVLLSLMVSIYAAGRVAKYLSKGTYATDMEIVGRRVTGWFSNASTAVKARMAAA